MDCHPVMLISKASWKRSIAFCSLRRANIPGLPEGPLLSRKTSPSTRDQALSTISSCRAASAGEISSDMLASFLLGDR